MKEKFLFEIPLQLFLIGMSGFFAGISLSYVNEVLQTIVLILTILALIFRIFYHGRKTNSKDKNI